MTDVYILINSAFDAIKIGMSGNVSQRIATLNSGVPAPFRVYATYTAHTRELAHEIESEMHSFLADCRCINGEFFDICPEIAYDELNRIGHMICYGDQVPYY